MKLALGDLELFDSEKSDYIKYNNSGVLQEAVLNNMVSSNFTFANQSSLSTSPIKSFPSLKTANSTFRDWTALLNVDNTWDFPELEVAHNMFLGDFKMVTFGASMPKLKDGAAMLLGCTALKYVTLQFDSLERANHLFRGCTSLETMEMNFPMLTEADYMFYIDTALTSVTGEYLFVATGTYMFYQCKELQVCPTSFPNLSDGTYMFRETLVLDSAPDTPILEVGSYMYLSSGIQRTQSSFEHLRVGNYMFSKTSRLDNVDITFPRSDVVLSYLFSEATGIKTAKITSGTELAMDRLFNGCLNLENAIVVAPNTSTGQYTFYNCTALKTADITSGGVSMSYLFANCSSLKSATVYYSRFVTGTNTVFSGCTNLEYLDINLPNLTSLVNIFSPITALKTFLCTMDAISYTANLVSGKVNLERASLSSQSLTAAISAFQGCTSLVEFMDSSILPLLRDATSMFQNCSSLPSINVDLIPSITNGINMFNGCILLSEIAGNVGFSQLTNGLGMFTNCNLDGTTINSVLDSLPAYTSGSRTITFTGCPGVSDCDPTIGTRKGWTVQL